MGATLYSLSETHPAAADSPGQRDAACPDQAAGIAHDINNLLSVIVGYSELVASDIDDAKFDTASRDLDEIRCAAERAADLAQRLLERVGARASALPELPGAIDAGIEALAPCIAKVVGQQIEVSLQLASRDARVAWDASELDAALLNLVINARDAMPQGGHLQIQTTRFDVSRERVAGRPSGLAQGRYVRIRVEDDGCGMSQDVAARAFERYFTTKGTGAGAGIGLANVKAAVERIGGAIRLETAPGEGSRFDLWLPTVHLVSR